MAEKSASLGIFFTFGRKTLTVGSPPQPLSTKPLFKRMFILYVFFLFTGTFV